MQELYKKLRKYEIRIRKAITSQMQGDFSSVFKGSGLEFDEVRGYQYGDDVRSIDWNVTAKGHGTYVRTYKEEKEQNVFFILDVSASQNIGNPNAQKIDIAKEICGVLSLSAVKEASQVGLISFSDKKELYIKPGKGQTHAYQIISSIFKQIPTSPRTNLNKAIGFALDLLKRKSLVIVISDFIDEGYFKNLKALAAKHDVVAIHLMDNRETELSSLGIIPLKDMESGKTIWTNTSASSFTKGISSTFIQNQQELETFSKKRNINYQLIHTSQDYIPFLIKLFKTRNNTKKNA